MTNDLQSILGELYTIDPSLRDHEAELIPVIRAMMRTRPDVTPDPAFVEHLRMTLREKTTSARHSQLSIINSQFLSFLTMNHLRYTVTGVVLGALVVAPLTYSLTQSGRLPTTSTESDSTQKLFSYSVENTGSKAFGNLSNANSGGGTPPASPVVNTSMMATRPQSGGGGPEGIMADSKMIVNPEMTEYHLIFDGQLPDLASSVDVFKRLKGASSADISKILASFNTGLINLSSFAGAKTDMISFYQDTKYGYMGTVSFRDGSISLNQNWEQWPHPENACQDDACFQRYRVKEADIPADDVLLEIANDFIAAHDIDVSQYGTPEVDRQYRIQYEAAADKSMFWFPDSVRVIYPLMIDGKPVYDEGGTKAGISIGVNVREKKVSDVWGITDQKYQKSSYPAVSDAETIKSYLANYGKIDRQWLPQGSTVKTADVTLGTPDISLVRMYSYENNASNELMVPALVFPVVRVSDGSTFYQTTITVPLAADLLKERGIGGSPVPMPLIMEDNMRAQ